MNLPRYSYKTNNNFLEYEFISVGPKGPIDKIVRFTEIANSIFNLAFGDLDRKSGEIDDMTITNNNDSHKILATVSYAVHDFTLRHKKTWIVAQGSTTSRTRLYRMGITNHWVEIAANFEVFGHRDDAWQPFEFRKDYDAFLIWRK